MLALANFAACAQIQEGLLYWCDARTDKIERINLETGGNRELVLAVHNMDMFAVSVFENYIYWSDRWIRLVRVSSIDKMTQKQINETVCNSV